VPAGAKGHKRQVWETEWRGPPREVGVGVPAGTAGASVWMDIRALAVPVKIGQLPFIELARMLHLARSGGCRMKIKGG
jgi:hypothetical protein